MVEPEVAKLNEPAVNEIVKTGSTTVKSLNIVASVLTI